MTEQPGDRARYRLLVVEDEPSIRTLLESTLRLTGYEVSAAENGQSALVEIQRREPHLVLLDVMLPDLDGFEVTQRLRAAGNDVPVLFLTARIDVDDRITGLSSGGDDYVTKPFHIDEVLLRIEAILRRTVVQGSEPLIAETVLRYADLELDEGAHEVHRAGHYVPLSPTEFKLLAYLLANPGRVLTKAQILDHVWSYDFAGDARIVETYVRYVRKKVDRLGPPLIHTVRGIGYCLRLPREPDGTAEP